MLLKGASRVVVLRARGSLITAQGRKRRMKRRRSGWPTLVVLSLISCLLVGAYLLWPSERPAHPQRVATVNRPTSAPPPQPPVPPSRTRAVEKLRSEVLDICDFARAINNLPALREIRRSSKSIHHDVNPPPDPHLSRGYKRYQGFVGSYAHRQCCDASDLSVVC
jgi:hypothetical protein